MANIFTHTIIQQYKTDSGVMANTTASYTDDFEEGVEASVLSSDVNKEIDLNVTVANIRSLAIEATKDMTLKTNNSATPQDTILLPANKATIWTEDSAGANPFSGDITKFFVTNTGGATGQFKFRCLLHQEV